MDYWYKKIKKDLISKKADLTVISEAINQRLLHFYMNKNIEEAQMLLNSDLKQYIDLGFKNSSVLEFISLLYDPNLKAIGYFLDWAKDNQQLNKISSHAIQNSILNAVNYSKLEVIDLLHHYKGLPAIDLSHCEYAAVTNCIPNNKSNPKKEMIFQYFITQCHLTLNPIIKKRLKKHKREDMEKWFDTLKLKNTLDNGLNNNLNNRMKIKI